MGLDVSSLMSALGAKTSEIQNKINSDGFDPSDQSQLLDMQMQIGKYQQMAGLTSAIISDIKQTAQGIIQKI